MINNYGDDLAAVALAKAMQAQSAAGSAAAAAASAEAAADSAEEAAGYAAEAFSGTPEGYEELVGDVGNLKCAIKDLDEQINGTSETTQDVTSSVVWVNGKSVVSSDGTYNYEATNYSSADIPLNNATHVAGYTRGGATSDIGLAFMSASNTWVAGYYNSSGGGTYAWNYSYDVPNGATILRICCATSKLSNFTCTLTIPGQDGLEDKVDNLQAQVDGLDMSDMNDVGISSPTDKQVLTYDFTSGKWINADQSADFAFDLSYTWLDGYFLNKYSVDKGIYNTNANRSLAIADVQACAGGYLQGYTRLAGDAAIAFFDSNGIWISEVTNESSNYDYYFSNMPVPINAKVVKVSCGTAYKSNFKLAGRKIAKGVNNVSSKSALEYICPDGVFGLDNSKSDFHYDSQTRLQDVYTWFDILAATFPRNITRVDLGDSTTPEGSYAAIDDSVYPIYAYVIQGDNYISGNDFIIASGIHGDESVGDGIQSVVSVAYFVRDMLCNPGKNKYLSFMKWNTKLLVIPVMNPWGYQNGKRCNGRGVDVNRNFDLNFDPDYESYGYSSGTAAFSENESLYVKNYIVNNFSTAKYCTELHTRGGDTLPSDDRWFTTTTSTATTLQTAVTEVGNYLRQLYGGLVSNGQQQVDALPPTFRAYTDHVIGIPTNLIECAKSVHMDIVTFNSDLVQRQYVQYLGAMTQKLVETFVM